MWNTVGKVEYPLMRLSNITVTWKHTTFHGNGLKTSSKLIANVVSTSPGRCFMQQNFSRNVKVSDYSQCTILNFLLHCLQTSMNGGVQTNFCDFLING
jgi:hypothetical protein